MKTMHMTDAAGTVLIDNCDAIRGTVGSDRDAQKTRCAIYARCASTDARPKSLEQQIRRCKEVAQKRGWTVIEEFIVADIASGSSITERRKLTALLRAAQQSPRPFDCVVAMDATRFGRNLVDVLKVCDLFQGHGVFVHFADEALDSRDSSFRLFLIMGGMCAEEYLTALRKKIYRGQKARALGGLPTGGRCYGYRSKHLYDINRTDEVWSIMRSGLVIPHY